MSTPTALKKGDKVAIICPASYISIDLTKAYDILKNWGLELVIYNSVNSQFHQFAGNDELRAQDLQNAIDDPEIKAIIAGRGGYGCVRIIDKINFDSFIKSPKWIVGFSDVTVLHSHINNNFGIETIHGQMVKSLLDGTEESVETLRKVLFGENIDLIFDSINIYNKIGEATGTLIGGNLAILHSILASDSDANYDDKILIIEDVGESLYNIDRMLWTLKRAKKLDNLKGLVVGGFTELKDTYPAFGQTYEAIIYDKIKEYNYPVVFNCPVGHIEDNRAIKLGSKIKLTVLDKKGEITFIS